MVRTRSSNRKRKTKPIQRYSPTWERKPKKKKRKSKKVTSETPVVGRNLPVAPAVVATPVVATPVVIPPVAPIAPPVSLSSSVASTLISHDGMADLANGTLLFDKKLSCENSTHNKFYHVQVVQFGGKFYSVFNWGKVGTNGQLKKKEHQSEGDARAACEKKIKEKKKGKSGDNRYQELQRRVEEAGGSRNSDSGIQVSLMWNNEVQGQRNDLDLHVITPSKEEIYYSHKKSRCGGALDVDRMQDTDQCVENTVWENNAPAGMYEVYVNNYSANGKKQKKDFVVGITIGEDHYEMFSTSMPPVIKKKMLIAKIEYRDSENFKYNFKLKQ